MIRCASQFLRFLAVVAALLLAGPALAVNFNITGTLPRNLSAGSFTVTVQVVGVTAQQVAAGKVDRVATNRLQLYLPQSVGGTNTPAAPSSTRVTSGIPYYVTITTSTPDTGTPSGSNFDFVYQVTFWYMPAFDAGGKNSPANLAGKGSPASIQVGAAFYLGGLSSNSLVGSNVSTPTTIKQADYVATEVPQFSPTAAVAGSMEQLTVSWVPTAQVAVTGTTGKAAPSGVNVIVIDTDVASQDLPGFKYKVGSTTNSGTSTDQSAACSYVQPTAVFSTCVSCPGSGAGSGADQIYLSTADMVKDIPGITVQTATNGAGSLTVNGLINNHRYVVFLQYDTPSITPADGQQCVIGVPSPNFTLSELNGEPGGRTVDFRCFIATAAYGSPLHRDLGLFRKFRDRVLLRHPIGQYGVQLYYRWSPPLADFISHHEWLRMSVRTLLGVPAAILEATDEWY